MVLCCMCLVQRMYACTAVIISGNVTADGRPMIWKNRDTGNLDNSIRHFSGEKYSFTGLVDSRSGGGEVWIGVNTAGFAVMNTASYCLKDDDVPASMMDREGVLMYRALEICATLEDFENLLDTLARPMGVEANFGCIDAHGGAAWYETDNDSFHKIDVSGCEDGYYVVTNFSVSGDSRRWKGIERHITACSILRDMDERGEIGRIRPLDIIDSLSRSYRQEILGIDLVRDAGKFLSETSGCIADLDFIPRRSTSASVVIHGVRDGGNPSESVLWAALGYPASSVAVPVPVSVDNHVPDRLSRYPESDMDSFCGLSLWLKDRFIFYEDISSMARYVDLRYVLGGCGQLPPMLECCRSAEAEILEKFGTLYSGYVSGNISHEEYLEMYDSISEGFFDIYRSSFAGYIHGAEPLYIRYQ